MSINPMNNLSNGLYTFILSTNDGCQISKSIEIGVINESYFSFSDSLFCVTDQFILPDSILTSGGVFSSQPILDINITNGLIDVSSVTPFQSYNISYITNNYCGLDTSSFSIKFNSTSISAFFSYDDSAFCNLSDNPIPDSVLNPLYSNFYSIPNTLPVNQNTGEIYLNPFISGDFDIVNVSNFGCKDTAYFQVTVIPFINSFFKYPSDSICFSESLFMPDSISELGGTFNSTSIIVDPLSGQTYLNTGINNSNHAISYNHNGFCSSSTTSLIYVQGNTSNFLYPNDSVCENEVSFQPIFIQNQNGYFFSLNSNLIIDSISGNINLTNTLPGTYSIGRITNDFCIDTSTVSLTILDVIDAAFYYPSLIFYLGEPDPYPISLNSGGFYSSTPPGLFLNTSTGLIYIENSNPGLYIVRHIIESECNDTAFFEVQISYDLSVIDNLYNSIETFDFYPNPSNNKITFKGLDNHTNISLECYDYMGKICFRDELNNFELDVSNLVNGIYYLKVYSNDSYLGIKKLTVTKNQ